MLVLAVPGIKVPTEENPRAYITDTPPSGAKGYEVPESGYYLRREMDGDLVRVVEAAPETKSAKKE
ncbi:MAG: hypothetical protein JWL63_3206 [Rhodocyclales bacterium]|nr:hypothetical protein [Rhodocyclales bacterium]